MKILVISQYYYPEQFRVTEICEKLVLNGHSVTVLTGKPNYPEGEIYDGYDSDEKNNEIINGVQIIRCNVRPRHKGLINLVLNYFSFVFQANKKIKRITEKYDLVYIYELSPITMAIPGIKFARKNKIPTYLYCLDLWPESVREISSTKLLSRHNIIYLITKYLSKKIYKSIDLIGVKCPEFKNYLNKTLNISLNKIDLLYEHAENTYLDVCDKPINNGYFDFMFLGNIGSLQNCEMFVEAFSNIKNKNNIRLHFVGDGSDLINVINKVKLLKLEDKVVFHGRVNVNDTIKFYNYCDCCLLSLSNRTACGLTLPAKLTGYMAAARPVLASINGASKKIIEDSNCGICIEYGDVNKLSDAMLRIIKNDELVTMGLNGRKYFLENFTLEKHISNLEQQFQKAINIYNGVIIK